MKKPEFILCADMHLGWKTPVNRKDGFIQEQWRKVRFLKFLQEKYDCPVLNAGDTFDVWRDDTNSNMIECILKMIECLPEPFITIYGQHEMPNHSMDNLSRSPLHLLERMGKAIVVPDGGHINWNGWTIYGKNYGREKGKFCVGEYSKSILLVHQLLWESEPFPGAPKEGNVRKFMKSHRGFDLIVSGDNHEPFIAYENGCDLVNCGSMMRRTVAQKDYRPSFWLWSRDEGVERIAIPIRKDVWRDEDSSIVMEGKEFSVVERIKGMNNQVGGFRSHLKEEIQLADHPVRLKLKSMEKEIQQ